MAAMNPIGTGPETGLHSGSTHDQIGEVPPSPNDVLALMQEGREFAAATFAGDQGKRLYDRIESLAGACMVTDLGQII
jgi:hypothetical protein